MPTIPELFELAVRYHQGGNLPVAESLYRDILHTDPRNLNALHLLGILANQSGRHEVGIPLIREAIALNPAAPDFHFNLGYALLEQGHKEEATECFRQTLRLNPRHVEALTSLGNLLTAQGKAAEATECFRQALAMNPNDARAHFNLGNLFLGQGELAQAADCYRQALRLHPQHADAHNNLGSALFRQGQLTPASEFFRQALRIEPQHADALNNLGNTLFGLGILDEAGDYFKQALQIKPDNAHAHFNLGNVLVGKKQLAEAALCFRQALRLHPNHLDARYHLGLALVGLEKFSEAEECFHQVLRMNPDHAEAHFNLGVLHFGERHLVEAAECFQQALRIDPGNATAYFQQGIALWEQGKVSEAIACYRRALELRPDFANAQSNLLYSLYFCPDCTPQMIYEEHRRWYQNHVQSLEKTSKPHGNNRIAGRRLRIGYVSSNYYMQAETFFTMPLFAAHDHGAFEIFMYADVVQADEMTPQIKAHADVWRDIVGLTDPEVAALVRQDQIDILVDLTMHMAKNRLFLFARKPAPLQVCWLAYQGTTGLATMDYRLTDAFVDPPGVFDPYYTEESVRLPDAFGCYDPLSDEPSVQTPPVLEKGIITFGSLNGLHKLNDNVVRLWARVLREVPCSRIMILTYRGTHRLEILDRFQQEGVKTERVGFFDRGSRQEYLRLYHGIDICLDTLPYNGQTTTLDSLWMGVPVITLVGQTAVGRASSSLLHNLGLPELIAQTPEQFVSLAERLAGDLPYLGQLHATLRERLQASPLMDGTRFARNVEAAYRDMWRKWCAV